MKRIAVIMVNARTIDVLVMLDGNLNLIVQVSTATIRKKHLSLLLEVKCDNLKVSN